MVDAAAALTAEGFASLFEEYLRSEISVYPMRSWWPSALAHPCDRHLVWRATRSPFAMPHGTTLQSIFDQGKDHEPVIRRKLETLGFEIMRDDRPFQYRLKGGAVISGKPDGWIVAFRGVKVDPTIIEIKSMSGFQFDQTRTVDDLRNARSHFTRAYYAQGIIYSLLKNYPRGVFVIESKATGLLRLIPYELDYAYAESLLARVERLQPLVDEGRDPDPIPYDGSICGDCGFRNLCYPPRSFGDGASVVDDPVLVEQLERREALREAHAEYQSLDKAVKARFKHDGVKFSLVGRFVVEGEEVDVKAYSVPARTDVRYSIRATDA